jgi:hypothetical protein
MLIYLLTAYLTTVSTVGKKKPQLGKPVSGSGFESRTSQIQSRSTEHKLQHFCELMWFQ